MAFAISSRVAPCGVQRRPQMARPVVSMHAVATKYKVTIEHEGKSHELEVSGSESILEVALDAGIDFPHDCKMGVCCRCASKLISGTVDLGGSMLSEEVSEKGYTLPCVATPRSDCKVATVSEDELLDEQFSGLH